MASRSTQPALYEKMRGRAADAPVPSIEVNSTLTSPAASLAHSTDSEVAGSWLRPGRVVRLPVGYVLLAAGISLALVMFAYSVGHSRGWASSKKQFDQYVRDNSGMPNDESLLVVDSMMSPAAASGASPSHRTPDSAGRNPPATADPSGWGPVAPAKDPRKRGWSYFVVAETNESGAIKLAEFCRAHGLETYVVLAKNTTSRNVIAFPGFDLAAIGGSSSPQVKAVRERIHDIGAKWKSQTRDVRDLRDAYLSKHGG